MNENVGKNVNSIELFACLDTLNGEKKIVSNDSPVRNCVIQKYTANSCSFNFFI